MRMTHDRARSNSRGFKSVEKHSIAENDFTEPPLIFNGRWDIPAVEDLGVSASGELQVLARD
jgi:hypothetical protein